MMADGNVVANDERMGIVRDMKHAEILDVRPVTDADTIHVAPDDRMKPGAAILAHDYVPDNDGGLFNKTGVRNRRFDALKCSDHDFNVERGAENSKVAV